MADLKHLPDEVEVSVQNPVRLDPHWELESDLALTRPLPGRVPASDQVLLVVEVAVSAIRRDREVKLPRYAAVGIPEAWIVTLPERCVEVYRQPKGEHCAECYNVAPGGEVRPQALSIMAELNVDRVLVSSSKATGE